MNNCSLLEGNTATRAFEEKRRVFADRSSRRSCAATADSFREFAPRCQEEKGSQRGCGSAGAEHIEEGAGLLDGRAWLRQHGLHLGN